MSSLSASELRAERRLQDRGQQFVERADLVAHADRVVQHVAEVRAHRVGDDVDLPLGELLSGTSSGETARRSDISSRLSWYSRADVVVRSSEDRGLQFLDVLLDRDRDLDEVVDHQVGDRVEHRGGAEASRSGCSSSRRRSSASPPCSPWRTVITYGAPRKTMTSPVSTTSLVAVSSLVLDVPRRLQHHEQRVVVVLELGPLVGVDRVLHRERVQSVPARRSTELGLRSARTGPARRSRPLGGHPERLVRRHRRLPAARRRTRRSRRPGLSAVVPGGGRRRARAGAGAGSAGGPAAGEVAMGRRTLRRGAACRCRSSDAPSSGWPRVRSAGRVQRRHAAPRRCRAGGRRRREQDAKRLTRHPAGEMSARGSFSDPERAELTVWRSASSMSATPSRRRASRAGAASAATPRPRPAASR